MEDEETKLDCTFKYDRAGILTVTVSGPMESVVEQFTEDFWEAAIELLKPAVGKATESN